VAVHWSKRRGEKNRADDDENHGIGIAEIKSAAAHLLEKEEDANGDDDGRADEGANRASRATASWIVVAHRYSSLLRTDEYLISAASALGSCDFFFAAEKTADHTASSINESKMSATSSMLNPDTQPTSNLLRDVRAATNDFLGGCGT
jgi:hypothetical protein